MRYTQVALTTTSHVYDARKLEVLYSLKGHTDTIISLELSPDSRFLLSNLHDATARTWDIRPFARENQAARTYDGATIDLEKNLIRASWSPQGDQYVLAQVTEWLWFGTPKLASCCTSCLDIRARSMTCGSHHRTSL
jgi:WD40 repeat protein